MESFAREYLGSVEVKSGAIRLQDARSTDGTFNPAVLASKTKEGFADSGGDLYVGTFFEEGRYSVFGRRNQNNELTSIELILDEVES